MNIFLGFFSTIFRSPSIVQYLCSCLPGISKEDASWKLTVALGLITNDHCSPGH